MSWTPPGGGAPVGPPATPDPANVPPSAAPMVGPAMPPVATAAVSAPPKGYALPIVVAVVGAILAGSLIGGVGTAIHNATAPAYPSYTPGYPDPVEPEQPSGDYSTLADGEPGSPVAVEPTVCNLPCYGEVSVENVILKDTTFARWYLSDSQAAWADPGLRTTADAAYDDAHRVWDQSGNSPDECFVTWSDAPIVEPVGAAVGSDLVAPLTEHWSDRSAGTTLTQSVRVFPDSASAEHYMQTLDAGLDACPRYKDSSGYPVDTVTREPGIHPPDNVAAVGFVRSLAGIRYYVMDLQRANLVIRSVAYSDGGIDDNMFRPLMQEQAMLLGDTDPLG